MSFGSSIAGLFGRSPIKPLQQHYDTVHDCARTLAEFFAAVTEGDWDKARAASLHLTHEQSSLTQTREHCGRDPSTPLLGSRTTNGANTAIGPIFFPLYCEANFRRN